MPKKKSPEQTKNEWRQGLHHQPVKWVTLFCLANLAMLTACSSGGDELVQIERPVEEIYNEALDLALSGDVVNAAPLFDEVERQHPYSEWSAKAQLMAAWALYKSNDYPAAIAALNRFIELNPAHPDIDYAYFLRGQSYYEQIVDVERDASMTLAAKEAFESLIRRFPNSVYARDAQLKVDLTLSHLAGKEMAVGRFYLKSGYYDAALRRFDKVITVYERSNQVPEALYRMVESYLALGIDNEAERSAAVLQYNFPDSIWTERMALLIDDPTRDYDPSMFQSLFGRATSWF
jgi:outer membrane protein assembly factor BamD